MKITILLVGETPAPMRPKFVRYTDQFQQMFGGTGLGFTFDTVSVLDGEPLPDPKGLEATVVTGSAKGVYDETDWMNPLRDFIRTAHGNNRPMVGICFGHQIIADALGGDVRKSDKGWGIGRHTYDVRLKPEFMSDAGDKVAIDASHQDQVITAPADAKVFLSSEFTPNAGLIYDNGTTISMQPHPEFDRPFTEGLVELRRDNPLTDDEVEKAMQSLEHPIDNADVAMWLGRVLQSLA
jgi:GMP synthase-like glutamine amidotransferase